MRAFTLVLPYYVNAGMLREWHRVWRDYPADLKAALHVIVVDDASPTDPARAVVDNTEPTGIASLRLFRNLKDVRWNWLFCRNLGVAQATTEWVLLTDIDHLLPAGTMRRLMAGPLDPRNVYRLSRVDAPHPLPYELTDCAVRQNKIAHPNTWIMTRGMYDAIGGYDERLSGCYGTDGEFKDRVYASARAVVLLPDVAVRYGREVLEDASTPPTTFTRKNDPNNDDDLRRRRAIRSEIPNWRPLRVTFPWVHERTILGATTEVAC